jgi:hypothetical protein
VDGGDSIEALFFIDAAVGEAFEDLGDFSMALKDFPGGGFEGEAFVQLLLNADYFFDIHIIILAAGGIAVHGFDIAFFIPIADLPLGYARNIGHLADSHDHR